MNGRAGDATGQAVAVGGGPAGVTLINGLTFVISDEQGGMPAGPFGLLVRDTRHLTHVEVTVAGEPARHLGTGVIGARTAHFHGYVALADHGPDAPLEIERIRHVVPDGLDEEFVLRLWSAEPVEVELAIEFGCDFADIFEVRQMRLGGVELGSIVAAVDAAGHITFRNDANDLTTTIGFDHPPHAVHAGRASWSVRLERGQPWRMRLSARAGVDGEIPMQLGTAPGRAAVSATSVRSDPPELARACRQATADFHALSMPDAMAPERRLLAAGIPWFVALFGRDSLIASHQVRAFDPARMHETLAALAARQGQVDDPANDEAPGKILHEVRLTRRQWLGSGTAGGARPYYGSIDATPLFLMLLATAVRFGLPREAARGLLPAARAALAWMRGPGDPDGDGFLEYRPTGPRSLANQAWKDSQNAVQFADGQLADGPIAMVEVQGYAARARRDLADVLAWLGEDRDADELHAEAEAVRAHVRESYWIPSTGDRPGFFAMALDGEKRQVASVASNMGHLLWCDVPSPDEAREVAEHLTSPALASGWGLRTLSAEMAGFNPISYHAGSVWPHDTAIACEGLRRYGLDPAALRLAAAIIDAAMFFDGRLPELFGGHRRDEGDVPVPYPNACSPQAWAAGVPLTLVATLLGLEPDIPSGRIAMRPILPAGLQRLEIRDIPFPTGPLSVEVSAEGTRLIAAPEGVSVQFAPRA